MGSGPFVFETWDAGLMQWTLLRNHNYFRGWPLDWPAYGGSKPQGYIEHYVVTWAYDWNARSIRFLSGDVDYCAVPRQYMSVVLNQPGIRCTYPLPSLAVDVLFYNYNIDPSTPFGPIYDYGVLGESGIPRDFFSDINVRKAFSHLIDFTSFYKTAYLGEAMQPSTAIIPGLPYYNAAIPKYNYDIATATTLLYAAWGGNLWTTGFTIQLPCWYTSVSGNSLLQSMLAAAINSLNPKFHATANSGPWSLYLYARDHAQLTAFSLGWLADYPDAHNFAYAFYYTYGNFAYRASYSDPVMDALIEQGIRTPDGPVRAQIYSDIQQRAIDTCPSIATDQMTGRHFERTWICGYYYSPSYSGNYVANIWKWFYTPHAQLDTVTNATANQLPCDVNYDGKIDMTDIGTTAASFGAVYGPPMSAKWNFRCDFNNDRKIDMKDISRVAKNFGKESPIWSPS